jgi:hypothetical protein
MEESKVEESKVNNENSDDKLLSDNKVDTQIEPTTNGNNINISICSCNITCSIQ